MPAVKDKPSRPSKAVAQSDSLLKLSFGTITKKREDARTIYPVLPDPNGQLAIIATRIIERAAQLDAIEGALTDHQHSVHGTRATYDLQAKGGMQWKLDEDVEVLSEKAADAKKPAPKVSTARQGGQK